MRILIANTGSHIHTRTIIIIAFINYIYSIIIIIVINNADRVMQIIFSRIRIDKSIKIIGCNTLTQIQNAWAVIFWT